MISNLESARALVKADLEHARSVLDLWSRQVSELEKTLEQMDAVGQSRIALRNEHTGVKAIGAGGANADNLAQKGAKRGRKPKAAVGTEPAVAATLKKERAPKKTAKAEKSRATEEKPTRARANGAKAAKVIKTQRVGAAKKRTGAAQPKFKDPNSDKTWGGHGRRPLWMTGDPQQYATQPDGSVPAAATQDNAAPAQA